MRYLQIFNQVLDKYKKIWEILWKLISIVDTYEIITRSSGATTGPVSWSHTTYTIRSAVRVLFLTPLLSHNLTLMPIRKGIQSPTTVIACKYWQIVISLLKSPVTKAVSDFFCHQISYKSIFFLCIHTICCFLIC